MLSLVSCLEINASAPWADCLLATEPSYGPLPPTSVNFTTSDTFTQKLFSHAEYCEARNLLEMVPGFEVLTEGGGYNAVWLETQPMAGAMYGLRNMTLALHNQLIFMRTQRLDGRLPGMVTRQKHAPPSGIIHPTYSYPGNANRSMLQGFYMASPAVDVAWLMNLTEGGGGSSAFLVELASTLSRFETWLWHARNSSHGVLWLEGTADTGEDGSDKYRSLPSNPVSPPFESMDMMGYAHDAQRALARIASWRGDRAAQKHWEGRMAATAAALEAQLWRPDLGACFDRERDGGRAFVTTLMHNNLRAMWHGAFSQRMADTFIARHLMNTSEFWTPTPLPSIAASDPRFKNDGGNDWSGQPEGLTFQRAIRALETYGHHAELAMAGARQRVALSRTMTFPQQIGPFTSVPQRGDCYGPMLLSMLEYCALATGIAVRPAGFHSTAPSAPSSHSVSVAPESMLQSESAAEIWWSSIKTDSNSSSSPPTFTFTQQLGDRTFHLDGLSNGTFTGTLNGERAFRCTGNTRVVTDLHGAVKGVVGVSAGTEAVSLQLPTLLSPFELRVAPNEEWAIQEGLAPRLVRKVPFSRPF